MINHSEVPRPTSIDGAMPSKSHRGLSGEYGCASGKIGGPIRGFSHGDFALPFRVQIPRPILIFLLLVPIIEIVLFIFVGGMIGFWPTMGVILGTGILGVALIKWQRGGGMQDMMAQMQPGSSPNQLFSKVLLMLAGLLLFIPGFFTDALGLALLLPPVRMFIGVLIAKILVKRLSKMASMGGLGGFPGMEQFQAGGADDDSDDDDWDDDQPSKSKRRGPVIDAEIIDDKP